MKLPAFDPNKIYTGTHPWMYKITGPLEKIYPEIKFTSYKHDGHIAWTFMEKNQLVRLVVTIGYDIMYLITGIFRLLVHPKQWTGIVFMVLFFLILIFPPVLAWRQWSNRNKFINAKE